MRINGTGQPPAPDPSQVEGKDKTVGPGQAGGLRGDEGAPPTAAAPSKGIPSPSGTSPAPAKFVEKFAEKFAGKLVGVPSTAATPAPGVTRPGDTSAVGVSVSDLAADLRSGRLTPTAAIDKVVERVISRQLGPDVLPEVRERVKIALQDAIESDPLLIEKLRQL